ncbi:PucR family transcriptional regulator ligand-binding domain-containing protein [Halobacillus litoralis]|uniref:PucR family transcriptional regulator n=1 Tax=Halobacillus litoralis TaxID=45668 RepID=UPI001CFF0486|nr:PucR family transcriptional regulator [Halobacillus litoralis]WLR48701.1 PucR family transcriptional regulator ligand-binding domain-containing protein [Halobacillus litoralis]
MGVAVEAVLKLPVLEKAKVQTDVYNRQVDWISVIETPVENFVRNNEFVLSTGVGCGDDVLALEGYVEDVIRSEASVLAFATGRHLYKIPDRVLKLAEKHELIVMEIPWEVRFGDILQDVLRLISEENRQEQQRTEEIRQELINCVLNGKGLQEITSIIYQNTGIPTAISDHNKQIRANQYFDRYYIDVLNGHELSQEGILVETKMDSDHPLRHYIETYEIGDQKCYQLTILSNYKKQGYILFKPKDEKDLTWVNLHILEHALTACALYFVKENAIEMTEIRLKDNFLLDLAKREREMDRALLSKAQLLGYDLEKPYICLVGHIRFVQPEEERSSSTMPQVKSSSINSRNYYIQKEVTHAGDALHRRTMTTFDEGEVIVYLETDRLDYGETANQFLDLIERRLHELLKGITISWGISCHKGGYQFFHKSYEEAETALKIGQQHEEGERTFFSDTRMNRLLMALSHEEEIGAIVSDTLEKLIDYDQKRQTELIHTFMVYNKYNSNVSQTARALNLHRQSLLHRLRNIEHLTGLSLLNADDLFLLELSVRLWLLKKVDA